MPLFNNTMHHHLEIFKTYSGGARKLTTITRGRGVKLRGQCLSPILSKLISYASKDLTCCKFCYSCLDSNDGGESPHTFKTANADAC